MSAFSFNVTRHFTAFEFTKYHPQSVSGTISLLQNGHLLSGTQLLAQYQISPNE